MTAGLSDSDEYIHLLFSFDENSVNPFKFQEILS